MRLWLVIASVWFCLAGCQGRGDLDGRRRRPAGLGDAAPAAEQTDTRRVLFDFYDNRAAAVVHIQGSLVVDMGTVALAKFTDDEQQRSWRAHTDDGRRVALIEGLGGSLSFPLDSDSGGLAHGTTDGIDVQLSLRSAAPDQVMSVLVNEKRVGDLRMADTTWVSRNIHVPGSLLVAGENQLRFYFRRLGEIDGISTAAAFERITLGAATSVGRGLTAGSHPAGGRSMDALCLPAAGRISYYMHLPTAGARLSLAVSAPTATAAASVHLATDSRGVPASERIWHASAGPTWSSGEVDVTKPAGSAVRVDFVTDAAACWARPRLLGDPTSAKPPASHADHVIVWVVSALRKDAAADAIRAPAMSRFASNAVTFSRASTSSPISGVAQAALMTGRATRASEVAADLPTLGEKFRAAGFATALVSGNGFVSDARGFARGFDVYDNPMRRRHPHAARILWQHAKKLLQKHVEGHVLLYVASAEPYLPFTPTDEALAAEWNGPAVPGIRPARTAELAESIHAGRERLTADQQAYVRALYGAEVRDSDRAFAQMLADVEALGLSERTAIVLVSDSGQGLFEHGELGLGHDLHEEAVNIAFAISAPGIGPHKVTVRASLDDVHATVLALAGIAPDAAVQGENLLPYLGGAGPGLPRAMLGIVPGRARSIVVGQDKLIAPARGALELYDLDADPGEKDNVALSRPITARCLLHVLSLSTRFEGIWNRTRWGTVNNVGPAFAADQGL